MSKWILASEAKRRAKRSREWLRTRVRDGQIRSTYKTVNGQRRLHVHAGDVERNTPDFVPKGHKTRRMTGFVSPDVEVGDPVQVIRDGRQRREGIRERGTVTEVHPNFVVVDLGPYKESFHFMNIKVEGRRR